MSVYIEVRLAQRLSSAQGRGLVPRADVLSHRKRPVFDVRAASVPKTASCCFALHVFAPELHFKSAPINEKSRIGFSYAAFNIGLGGFEPPTPCPPDMYAKPLRYSPSTALKLSYRPGNVNKVQESIYL